MRTMEQQTKHMTFLELLDFAWTVHIRDEYYTTLDGEDTIYFNDRGYLEARNVTIADDDCFVVKDYPYIFEKYKEKSEHRKRK